MYHGNLKYLRNHQIEILVISNYIDLDMFEDPH
jgi:hypothetical protein